jgi:hypothetical protein
MRKYQMSTIIAVTIAIASLSMAQDASSRRLQIAEKDGAYELVVPVSRLFLRIPKEQLVQAKLPSDSPRYFSFQDRDRALIVSGWFEPEGAFTGMDAFWSGEQRGLNRGGFQIEDVTRERNETWQVVLYDVRLPGAGNFHMRAEHVRAGTWIDLHLSVTSKQSQAEARKLLWDTLKTIQVLEQR